MRGEYERRPQAFAFTEQAVAHDLIDAGRRLQDAVDLLADIREVATKGFQSRALF